MSKFYRKEHEPKAGDIATHAKYGTITLIGTLTVNGYDDGQYWLTEDNNNELKVVNVNDLEDIGYYGD